MRRTGVWVSVFRNSVINEIFSEFLQPLRDFRTCATWVGKQRVSLAFHGLLFICFFVISQFRSFGKWVSKLCSLKFWMFYHNCKTFRIWAFLRNLCGHRDFRYLARSVGSGTTESVSAARGSTTQDGTDAIHGCCAMLFLFSWLDTERLSGRAMITSLMSMRSVCAVSRSVIRCVLRVLRSPDHTITTNALYVSDSASNVLSTNPKEKLSLPWTAFGRNRLS